MQDVLGQVLISARDKGLFPVDPPGRAVHPCPGPNTGQIRPRPRFGQAHGVEDVARGQTGQPARLLVGTAKGKDRAGRPCDQPGHHLQRQIRPGKNLGHTRADQRRQGLPPKGLGQGQPGPAVAGVGRIGGGKSIWGTDPPPLDPAALPVADLVEGCQHAFGEGREMAKDVAGQVTVPIGQVLPVRGTP